MKKIIFLVIIFSFILSITSCKPEKPNENTPFISLPPQITDKDSDDTKEFLFDQDDSLKDQGYAEFSDINVFDLVRSMGAGWNLGNTLDATDGEGLESEISWGQPLTTKAMIDGLKLSGIKTIRIPVSWHNHIIDKESYTISPQWMARVKTIVDWAISDGLYVIINSHHDNYLMTGKMPKAQGYYPSSENLEESQRYLYNIWGQIGRTFNQGYDEHLIFETMNEPRPAGTECEWWYDNDQLCIDSIRALNELNQTALDAIRATGGNNTKRFVMCPSLAASENAANAMLFEMPKDLEKGRLILSVHAYTPYSFAMENPGERTFTAAHKAELDSLFERLENNFIDKGYPVIIGEYGATNKDNLQDRVKWFDYYINAAAAYNIPCILWDNGVWQLRQDENGQPDYSEGYGFYNRLTQEWYFPDITRAIIEASE